MNELVVKSEGSQVIADNSLNSLTERFISAQDVKLSSRDTYKTALKAFIDWLSAEAIHNPVREDILAYKDSLQKQGLSSFTVSSYMVAVRKLFEYLESTTGYQNVAKGIKGAKRSKDSAKTR